MSFEVGDHDFTKFSLVPSVTLVNDIPDDVSKSWYTGRVFVSLKDAALEPSSPLRHITELEHILVDEERKVLLLYSDGGPDHRVTYLSVQVSLIALFIKHNLDYLCAARTAPCHSWRNPVERIMSVLNLGLQCVGLMRKKMDDKFEDEATKCNSLAQLRVAAMHNSEFRSTALDSISSVKILLSQIFRLELKDEKFNTARSASQEEMDELWSALKFVDTSLKAGELLRKANLRSKPNLQRFLDHCCVQHHYFFQIKKCGSFDCDICKPPVLSPDTFKQLHQFPDPIPGADGHFLPFIHHPSSQKKTGRNRHYHFAPA